MERKLRLRGVQSFVYLTNCKNCGDSLGLWVLTVEQERLKIWKSVHLALSHTFHFGKPAKQNTTGTLQIKTNPLALRQKNTIVIKDKFFLSEYMHVSTMEIGT